MKISIIIPAYNEEKRIGNTLNEYSIYFEKLKKVKEISYFEILVVLNGCKDGTLDIVKSYKKMYKEIRFLDLIIGGKGYAITEGFKDSLKRDVDIIGFVDADMATTPEYFYDLIKKIKDCDGVIASRWIKDSVIKTHQTLLRMILSRGFNFITRSLLFIPYTDTQCGAKVFKRDSIEKIIDKIGRAQWAFDVELLYEMKKEHLKIIECPTVWEDKKDSKLNVTKVPFQMFLAVIRIRLINSQFKFIIKLYDKLPKKYKFHNLR